jgi:restriction endonuclease S subunit
MSNPWPTISAGRVARIEIGGTPSRNNPVFWARGQEGYPWVSIADMRADIINDTNERITEIGVRGSNVKRVPTGTPLMSFKLTVGRVAIAGTDLFTNEAIAAFHVDENEVSPRWLFHLLPSAASMVVTDSAIKGATLNKAKLQMMELVHPPLPEQRRIAKILDALDEAIRKTELVIAKLQQMKQGLLHDLLTRGIDENGELRDPQWHPEQFKDSPLGRIPSEWQAKQLGDIASIIDPNPSHRYPNEVTEGVPIASTENFAGEDDFDLSSATHVPSAVLQQQLSRCGYTDQDVIFARKGRIGLARRYGTDDKVFSHTIVVMKPRGGTDDSFLLWLVRSRLFFAGIRKRMNSNSGVPTLGVDFLARVPVPQPSPAEQKLIAKALDDSQSRLISESLELSKLQAVKNGIVDDLLTGRVRVRPEEAE